MIKICKQLLLIDVDSRLNTPRLPLACLTHRKLGQEKHFPSSINVGTKSLNCTYFILVTGVTEQ